MRLGTHTEKHAIPIQREPLGHAHVLRTHNRCVNAMERGKKTALKRQTAERQRAERQRRQDAQLRETERRQRHADAQLQCEFAKLREVAAKAQETAARDTRCRQQLVRQQRLRAWEQATKQQRHQLRVTSVRLDEERLKAAQCSENERKQRASEQRRHAVKCGAVARRTHQTQESYLRGADDKTKRQEPEQHHDLLKRFSCMQVANKTERPKHRHLPAASGYVRPRVDAVRSRGVSPSCHAQRRPTSATGRTYAEQTRPRSHSNADDNHDDSNNNTLDDAIFRSELDALRRELNAELLHVLIQEQHAEEQREHLVAQAADAAESNRMERVFRKERTLASERITRMTESHDRVLAARIAAVQEPQRSL